MQNLYFNFTKNKAMRLLVCLFIFTMSFAHTVMSQEQADYIGVPVDGPYKPAHYRY